MKVTIFQSDKGDCLLLTSSTKKHVLIDGGMSFSYREHVAKTLGDLAKNNETLDLIFVSHTDEDHISGILQLMDDEVAWRVHDFQIKHGNPTHKPPKAPRPPKVKAIWHNAFHEQTGKNTGPIQNMLAAMAPILLASDSAGLSKIGVRFQNLATSIPQGIELSRRIGNKQLGIPLNPQYGGKLVLVTDPPAPGKVAGMSWSVVGPYAEDLEVFRGKWNAWLKSAEGKKRLKTIQQQAKDDEKRLHQGDLSALFSLLAAAADDLGKRSAVTAPNLASIMALVDDGGKTLLLTGDGHWQDVVDGLTHFGLLNGSGALRVNALKVPHHGSENNTHADFCKAVIADHYLFCGDGAHHNPDQRVVKAFIDSRIGPSSARSPHPLVDRPFTLWFSSHHSLPSAPNKKGYADRRKHMKAIETFVKKRASASNGKLKYKFLDDSKMVLNL